MHSIKYYLALITLIFPLLVYSQKRVNLKGEYTYVVPKDVSINEAKAVALERAKIEALSRAFGTIVSQHNTTITTSENSSNTSFFSLGRSSVRGEWIKTIGEPKYNKRYENKTLIVTAEVSGVAREIKEAKITVEARILRNGTEDKFESDAFRDGDDMFVSFASPADGYISIYLVNQENKAYCLLPYMSDSDGKVEVSAGEKYVFFSAKNASKDRAHLVDEYSMSGKEGIKYNTFYFIFSPNKFTKALDVHSDKSRPRQLSFVAFEKWLTDLRIGRTDVQLIKKTIHITQ